MLTRESPTEAAEGVTRSAGIRRPGRWLALLAGSALDRSLAAIAIALLGDWLVARLTGQRSAPETMAEWIMARTPADLANLLLDRLGALARPAAVLGGFACYLLVGLAVGLLDLALAHRRRARRPATISSLPAIAVAAVWGLVVGALGQPWQANALLVTLFVASWLAIGAARTPPLTSDRRSRRAVLQAMALGSGAVLVSANIVLADTVVRAWRGVRLGGERLFAWSPPDARTAGFDLPGLSPEVTPVADFYRMSKNIADPAIPADEWSLRIGGLVQRDLRLSYGELMALPRRDVYATLRCISNRIDGELMGTALFSGVPLRVLLERTGVDPAAQTAVFRSPDGHSDSLDLGRALAEDTLIAYAMNGRTLTREHGFPARLLAPGVYGFKHVKWLERIDLIEGEYTGHWQALGWTHAARVKTMARIDTARRKGEHVLAAGVAYAGDRGILSVEVRSDDGEWREATLHVPPLSRLTWVQWRVALPAGTRAVTVRAIDGDGVPQEERGQGQFPDGAQGLHRMAVR